MEAEDKCARESKPHWPQNVRGGLLSVLEKSVRTSKDRRVGVSRVHIHILVCEHELLSPMCALSTASLPNRHKYLVNSDLSFQLPTGVSVKKENCNLR